MLTKLVSNVQSVFFQRSRRRRRRQTFHRFTKTVIKGHTRQKITKSLRKVVILIACEYVNYEELGILHRLPGCHNDIKKMKNMLISHYEYKHSDFIILSDECKDYIQPTQMNIMKTLEKVTQDIDLSQIVIYYSGHGTRTKDKFYKKNQSDKIITANPANSINIQKYLKTLYTFEDCVVPCDYLEAGLISDVYFRTHFWSKIPVWTRITAIFDSCNSGSIFNLPFRYKGENTLERDLSFEIHKTAKSQPISTNLPFIITISGCRNDQKSVAVNQINKSHGNCADYDGKKNQWEGCMSVAFHEVLKSRNFGKIGLDTLIDEMRSLLKHWNYPQIPQLSLSQDVVPSSVVQLF